MIKIKLEQDATVYFPNLGTSVSMHRLGLRITDRCGKQRLRNTVLLNGVVLSEKKGVVHIKEPYNCKVLVNVQGKMEIESTYLAHQVSGMEVTRTGAYHPDRGTFKLKVGDVFDFTVNTVSSFKLTATGCGATVEALGRPAALELE